MSPNLLLLPPPGRPPPRSDVTPGQRTREFLASRLPSAGQDRLLDVSRYTLKIEPEQRPSYKFVKKQKEGATPTPSHRRGKVKLSRRKRKQLGLERITERKVAYESLLEFARLWREYATTLLDLNYLRSKGWNPNVAGSPLTEVVQNKVKKIEYFGSILEVHQSRCPNLVSLKGIVLKESKLTFCMATRDNRVVTVPKLNSVFKLQLEEFVFYITGAHTLQRPVERARANLKSTTLWPCGPP